MFDDLLLEYDGNWRKVMEHVVIKRLILSEKDRALPSLSAAPDLFEYPG